MPEQRNTFPKSERLCGSLRIKEVATTGKSIHEPPIRLTGKLMPLPTDAPAQAAFAVPSRNLKRAVDRNRINRIMREAFRLHKHAHYDRLRAAGLQCAWLFTYQGKARIPYAEASARLTRALERWMQQHV